MAQMTRRTVQGLDAWAHPHTREKNGTARRGVDAQDEGLRRRYAVLEAIGLIAERLMETSRWEEAAQDVLERLGRAAGASRVYLLERDDNQENRALPPRRYVWSVVAAEREADVRDPRESPMGVAIPSSRREMLLRGKTVQAKVHDFPPGERETLAAQNALSLLLVPVFVGEKWWGTLRLDDCRRERDWSRAETGALRTAARILGACIRRCEAERTLRETNETLRELVETSPPGISMLNRFGDTKAWNPAAERIFGWSEVAHDFNNLLSPLISYPQLIKEELPRGHPALRYCDIMMEAASRMAEINADMLALARRGRVERQPVDLNRLALEAVSQMLDRPNTLALDLQLDPFLPPVAGSPAQLLRVLANLISNARDAMEDTGILAIRTQVVEAEDLRGKSSHVQSEKYVRLDVADTGCGIPKEIQNSIFDTFFTTKRGDSRRGSGLGLSVVQAIVEDHCGFVELESEVDKGSTFRIYLPASRDQVG